MWPWAWAATVRDARLVAGRKCRRVGATAESAQTNWRGKWNLKSFAFVLILFIIVALAFCFYIYSHISSVNSFEIHIVCFHVTFQSWFFLFLSPLLFSESFIFAKSTPSFLNHAMLAISASTII
jgi:hypothetical protein